MSRLTTRVAALFGELRRRHVFRVALAYGAVAWLLVQMSDVVFPALGMPDWTITFIVVLVLVGFPIAMLLAWAYDITPTGLERTLPRSDVLSTMRTVRSALAPHDAVPERARPRSSRSIAALPFVNLSRDLADEYFSDGLTEELINALTHVSGLRVAARTSAFAFKGSTLDVREIGERLGVKHVLEGSVRSMSGKVRMAVQLIDVDDGYCLWSESFDREMDDIFRIQQEIAQAVVERIMTGEAADGGAQLRDQPTANLQAFQLYLKGRYFWNRRGEADLRHATEQFEQAIDADPAYALAHAGLADTYSIQLDHGLISPDAALPRAIAAAERALRLDPTLAEAHTSLAIARQFEWRWAVSEAGFRQALQLNPAYPVAHHRFALFLAWTGRGEEAMRHIEEARRLDPVNLIVQSTIGWILYYRRRFDDAALQLRSTVEMDPHFANAHVALALVELAQGRPQVSIGELDQAIAGARPSTPTLALLGHAHGAAGDEAEARRALTKLGRRAAEGYVSAYYRALPHLGLGENDIALEWLEQAQRERAASLVYIAVEPLLDPLRGEARFHRLLQGLRFPGITVG